MSGILVCCDVQYITLHCQTVLLFHFLTQLSSHSNRFQPAAQSSYFPSFQQTYIFDFCVQLNVLVQLKVSCIASNIVKNQWVMHKIGKVFRWGIVRESHHFFWRVNNRWFHYCATFLQIKNTGFKTYTSLQSGDLVCNSKALQCQRSAHNKPHQDLRPHKLLQKEDHSHRRQLHKPLAFSFLEKCVSIEWSVKTTNTWICNR